MDYKEEYILEFKTMSSLQCRWFVIFIVLFSLLAAAGFFIALITSPTTREVRFTSRQIAFIFGSIGILVFMICAFFAGLFGSKTEMKFMEEYIVIKRKKEREQVLQYSDISECFILNSTDYSRVRITMKDGKRYTYYVGLCQMLKSEKQIILKSNEDLDIYFRNFKKELDGKKGGNTITYINEEQISR